MAIDSEMSFKIIVAQVRAIFRTDKVMIPFRTISSFLYSPLGGSPAL
jgi:hypothetical protein